MSEFIFVSEKDFSLRAQETIRELSERPWVLLRLALVGPHFPHRNSVPFLRIVQGRETAESLMAEISTDQKELRGYFPTDVKIVGHVEFGYASQVLGRIPIKGVEVKKLDPEHVDPRINRVTLRDLGPFRRLR